MRDVNNGWLIRYLHANTASAFFFLVLFAFNLICFYLCVIFYLKNYTRLFAPPIHIPTLSASVLGLVTQCSYSGSGENKHGDLSSIENESHTINASTFPLYSNSLSDSDFSEWLRGFVDAEGCFYIHPIDNHFKLVFEFCLHLDELPLLKYLLQRLGIGRIYVKKKTVNYIISKKEDLLKFFSFFDSLNTSKNLNYQNFKQAFYLYHNRGPKGVSTELREKVMGLKNEMNKKRINFNPLKGHSINITSYWLLGFVEGDGYFSSSLQQNIYYSLKFGIGQTSSELGVLEAIQKFLYKLPGKYLVKRNNTNLVKLETYNQAQGRSYKPMSSITVNQTDFLTNVIVPFFDNLIWLSKKEKDYKDWKLILNIINQGKHFTDEGKELISLIKNRMNTNRLSTNLAIEKKEDGSLDVQALNLLSSPSNYEVQSDGKILIKSLGRSQRGRGNTSVKVLDDRGTIVYAFDSIKDCALFFNVHTRTINRRLEKGSFVEFEGKKLVFKREVPIIP